MGQACQPTTLLYFRRWDTFNGEPAPSTYNIYLQKKQYHYQVLTPQPHSNSPLIIIPYLACHPFASDNRVRTLESTKFDSMASSRGVLPSPFTARGSAPLQTQLQPLSSMLLQTTFFPFSCLYMCMCAVWRSHNWWVDKCDTCKCHNTIQVCIKGKTK